LVVIRASSNEKIKKGVKLFQKISGNPDTLATSLTLALWIFAIELQHLFFNLLLFSLIKRILLLRITALLRIVTEVTESKMFCFCFFYALHQFFTSNFAVFIGGVKKYSLPRSEGQP